MEFETLRNSVILECQKTEERLISRFYIVSLITVLFLVCYMAIITIYVYQFWKMILNYIDHFFGPDKPISQLCQLF